MYMEEVASDTVHVFFICDVSGSMKGGRLNAVNQAIKLTLKYLQKCSVKHQKKQCYINAICYASHAHWHVSAAPLDGYDWLTIQRSGGLSNLGKAYKLLASRLKILSEDQNQQSPIIVLLSDGKPTDDADVFLNSLLRTRAAQSALRIPIGIGNDIDMTCLHQFRSDVQQPIKVINSLHDLTYYLAQSLEQAVYSG